MNWVIFPLLLLTSSAIASAASPPSLSTLSEQSQWKRTGRYNEVVALCDAFARRYPGKVRCEKFGETPEGRPMVALIASTDGTLSPQSVKARNRPVVFAQGGIHAGEIDGKDAGFWALRELLEGRVAKGALSKVTFVFVPVFNIDGHERFGPHNRPNQVGPEQMGWRVTSQNLNLNRDYAKADAPEMRAMLELLGRYDPIVLADLHVTDGAKFQHDVAVIFEPYKQGPPSLRAQGQALHDALFAKLTAQGHLPLDFYPAFVKDDDPFSGFEYYVPPPRFSSGYWQLRNRFGILLEVHSWKDYATRVKATFNVVVGLVELAATQGREWLAAAKKADAEDAASSSANSTVTLTWDNAPEAQKLSFLGYAFSREKSELSGQPWIRYDDTKPEVWQVPYFAQPIPKDTVTLPRGGYVVTAAHASWVGQKLKSHGIAFETVKREIENVAVQEFRGREVKLKPESFEGHQRLTFTGEWAAGRRSIPKGSLYVPAAQAGRRKLIAHLFEPLGPDSFLQWGFFNIHFEQKEYMEDYVAEEVARQMLKDPKVKQAFDAKLAADKTFAGSAEAKLTFFYERHPSYDERFNLYPVYRVDAAP